MTEIMFPNPDIKISLRTNEMEVIEKFKSVKDGQLDPELSLDKPQKGPHKSKALIYIKLQTNSQTKIDEIILCISRISAYKGLKDKKYILSIDPCWNFEGKFIITLLIWRDKEMPSRIRDSLKRVFNQVIAPSGSFEIEYLPKEQESNTINYIKGNKIDRPGYSPEWEIKDKLWRDQSKLSAFYTNTKL